MENGKKLIVKFTLNKEKMTPKEKRIAGGTIRQIVQSMQMACNLSNEDVIDILGNASVKYANEIDRSIKSNSAEMAEAINDKINKERELVKPITDKLLDLNAKLEKTVIEFLNDNPDVLECINQLKEKGIKDANVKYYSPITDFHFHIEDVPFLMESGFSEDVSCGFNIGEIHAGIC